MTRTPRRRLLLVAFLSLSAACGSTVQVPSTLSAEQAVGDDATAGSSMPGADAGLGMPGGTSVAGTTGRMPTATGGGAAGGQTGGGTSGGRVGRPPAASGAAPGSAAVNRPATGEAANLPGVTKTTITVGVIAADPSTNQTMEDAGLGAASVGNEPANWEAMADEVNARGGIAGRRLDLIFYLVNLTESPQSQGQEACTKFTQDNTVAAVVSGYYYSSAHICLSQKGVPSLLGTNYGVDSTLAKHSGTVVAWATPLLDRLAAMLPGAFQRMGKLEPGTTAGIFVTDAPAFRRSAARLSADLTKRGLQVLTQTVRDSDTGDYSGASTDASGAVLRFRSADVTEVLFLTRNAWEPTNFMQAANSQGYKPTYLLSSQQYPAALVGLVPPEQLAGAVAVGWAPAIDLDTGYDESRRARQCLSTLRRHGRSFRNGTQALAGLLACDGVDLLERAAEQPDGLSSRDALLRAALHPGTRFVSAVTFKTSFPSGRRDGVAAYRPMAYSEECGCFNYHGAVSVM